MAAREQFANSRTASRRGSAGGGIFGFLGGKEEERAQPAGGGHEGAGYRPYKPDIQTPLFSAPASKATHAPKRRSSLNLNLTAQETKADDDAMAMIVADSDLWREFQARLKTNQSSGAGAKARAKEVLREFVKEKGLDQAEKDNDASRTKAPISLFQALNQSTTNLAPANESLADRFKERAGLLGPTCRHESTAAEMVRALRRRSSMTFSSPSSGYTDFKTGVVKRSNSLDT